jgi:osmotically-inducible protein OsmY
MRIMSHTRAALIITLIMALPLLQACAATATRESTGEYLDDVAITAKVKAQLIGDPAISGFGISVETFRARVILSGFVNSQSQIDRAVALAREVSGVREVQSALVIKSR